MLSSRFLVVSFLYLFYATGLVAAEPHHKLIGGNQLCQSVQTVTVTQTVTPGQPSPSSRPAKSANSSPPAVTTRPGKVNLGNGATSTTSSSVDTMTSSVKSNKNNTKKVNTKTGNGNKNTKNVNTKTSSVLSSSTGLPITSLPPVSTTGRSLAVSSSSTAAPPANTGAGNPATSLTLDPSVIQNVNGKGKTPGETDSLVSPNNFINSCVGKTITNGKQVRTGSCNPTPMGDIPNVDSMPSAKFNSPKNFGTIPANTPFTISLQVRNLVTGLFTNAANTYYAAPQQLVNGVIQGHSHVTVQQMTSLSSPQPLNPRVFAFFKGLNAAANNGVLTADVTKGLPAGVYRISSINSAGNHQEALGPVAQRGSFNDVIYVTVTDGGNNTTAVSSSALPPASSGVSSSSDANPTSSVSSSTGKGGKGLKTSSTASLPVSTGTGGKNTIVSSSEPPVSTGRGGKKGGKGGNVVLTSASLPDTTPAAGNSKTDAKNLVASSSAVFPDSTSTQGATSQGGKGPEGGSGPNSQRMYRRSRRD